MKRSEGPSAAPSRRRKSSTTPRSGGSEEFAAGAEVDTRWRADLLETSLMMVSRDIRKVHDAHLKAMDLNLTEANLLVMIQEHGPLPQATLAQRYGVGRARVGAVIDHLERMDVVRRVADPADRRVWLVETTRAGNELADWVIDNANNLQAALRHGLNPEEQLELAKLLERLQTNLVAMYQPTDERS